MAKCRGANGTGSMHYDKKRKLYSYRVTVGDKDDGYLRLYKIERNI